MFTVPSIHSASTLGLVTGEGYEFYTVLGASVVRGQER